METKRKRGGRPGSWTRERENELRALWDTKTPITTIGKVMGLSKGAIASKVRTMNLMSRRFAGALSPQTKLPTWRGVPVYKTKSCLKCRKQFQSSGNFLCEPCRDINRGIAPMAEGFAL